MKQLMSRLVPISTQQVENNSLCNSQNNKRLLQRTDFTRTKPIRRPQPPSPQELLNILAPSTKHSQKPEINQNKKQAFTW